ncbi:MAG: 50S ribosomal protein L4 [Candidatus Blackburnbacteria bacterium]|nr:50S ribosomal protein L4 [Candidatus Blackburnbacteria bacterium]
MAARISKQSKSKSEARAKVRKVVLGLEVPLYVKAGVQEGTVELPKEIFGQKPNKVLIAQAVRVFLSRQRMARASVKTRAQVDLTKKKMYRQKGTGGARHGAQSAPIFVGGGSAHGPKAFENYKLLISKKMSRKALFSALSERMIDKRVLVADIEGIAPKTRDLVQFLKNAQIDQALIVHKASENLLRAGRNIKNIAIVRAGQLNAYDVLRGRMIVLTKEALDVLAQREGRKA